MRFVPADLHAIDIAASLESSGISYPAFPMPLIIRSAVASDCALVLTFIRDLASYEQLMAEFQASEEKLHATLFAEKPSAECLLAFVDDVPAAFAVFHSNYSTFLARPGLYVEDIFVKPAFRKRGIGRALLARVATLANERGCGRVEWTVLDWNEPAIEFYKTFGAAPLEDWRLCRLSGPALAKFAANPTGN
jgi:GNAT superfamily N-acetyltransferase